MDYHMALYLCRETRRHLEELVEERNAKVPSKCKLARDLEGRLNMKLEQMISALLGLEVSISAQDAESMVKYESLIDSLVDFLDRLIDTAERGQLAQPHGIRMQELKAWRESSGKLAQLLCQSIE